MWVIVMNNNEKYHIYLKGVIKSNYGKSKDLTETEKACYIKIVELMDLYNQDINYRNLLSNLNNYRKLLSILREYQLED